MLRVSFDDWAPIVAALQKRRIAAAVVVGSGLFFGAVFSVGGPLSELFKRREWSQWVLLIVGVALSYSLGLLLVDAALALGRTGTRLASDGGRAAGTMLRDHLDRRALERSAHEQLRRNVQLLSPSQRRFLDLFAPVSATATLMTRELLPREVYTAGGELQRLGIITLVAKARGPHWTERYALVEDAVPLLQEAVFQGPAGRREVRLDLSRVQGTGASGSGAPGGRGSWR